MKILITGANGQLGYHLKLALAEHELYLGDTDNYDITNSDIVRRETEGFRPALIIHAAAYTNVDAAEANQALCRAINVDGTAHVAQAAQMVGAKLVALSTDYVFAGSATQPYQETDQPRPGSFYGQTKYEGEQAAQQFCQRTFIARTSWLYGGPPPGPSLNLDQPPYKNFVYTMLRLGRNQPAVTVVNDQVGAPTYAADLAVALKALAATEAYGIYHLTNSGQTNWAELAQTIFKLAGYPTTVNPISSQEWAAQHPNSTKRPAYSVLGHSALLKLGLADLPSWDNAIARFLVNYAH